MPRDTASARAESRRYRELLERMAVQLVVTAEECADQATRLKLRQVVEQTRAALLPLDEAYAKLHIVQDFIPVGRFNRPGKRLVPTAITIHNTDNAEPGADAAAHALYQKSRDARTREVSWHFTVDDKSVYQSLPINEIGWHTGTKKGNETSIGVQICMHADLDAAAAYRRAALLTAVLAFQSRIEVPNRIFQHYDWTGKNCPRILRDRPAGWQDFLAQIQGFMNKLVNVPATAITPDPNRDRHHI